LLCVVLVLQPKRLAFTERRYCMYYQLQCFALAKYVMIFSNCLHE
jgi:hypothetical protein